LTSQREAAHALVVTDIREQRLDTVREIALVRG